ncbi:DNA replication regulator SLD2 [Sphaceloma murrayae]|uniref:DNA replication regulator SLD2 n=1 Tax=Sphaceloma murrayae TaxID=2082308 RepID=A0A2K1QQZ8_9PEZI|nr:DNA replication regulator SLD2 [Sphaceloma murrayae]
MADDAAIRLRQLKAELKIWEKSFAAANDGRKPTKADVRLNVSISAKYKAYNELCRPQKRGSRSHVDKIAPGQSLSPPQQGPQLSAQQTTPSKRRIIARPLEASPWKSPLPKAMSPTPQAIRRRLGPTPQKDGQILGLFDSLGTGTPSKGRRALANIEANVAATPSKEHIDSTMEETERIRLGRTPTSNGKRYMLDVFATPEKRKRDEPAQTPSGVRGVNSTPQFLRRSNVLFARPLDTIGEAVNETIDQSQQPPFKKRSLCRSLSSIIRGLRAQEADKADEDLELLRELEGGSVDAAPAPKKQPWPTHQDKMVMETQVEMPLGPDAAPVSEDELSDSDITGALDANGQPRKIWKKKGLKRQTKRVIMRPVLRQVKPSEVAATDLMDFSSVKDDKSDAELDKGSGESDFSDSDEDARRESAKKSLTMTKKEVQEKEIRKEEPKKRKVSAAAHANYCRLKIKNKNSKGKGRGRFGRR